MTILQIIGVVLYLYLGWRSLKEDYKNTDIAAYIWLSLFSFLLGGRIVYGFENWGVWNDNWWEWFSFWLKPGFSLSGGYISWFLASYIISNDRGWKLWSVLEDITPSFLILVVFLFMGRWLVFGGAVVFLVLSLVIGRMYRSFFWYKSGKKGFVYFFVNIILFLILSLEALFFKRGVFDVIYYSILTLISLGGLVILGDVAKR